MVKASSFSAKKAFSPSPTELNMSLKKEVSRLMIRRDSSSPPAYCSGRIRLKRETLVCFCESHTVLEEVPETEAPAGSMEVRNAPSKQLSTGMTPELATYAS